MKSHKKTFLFILTFLFFKPLLSNSQNLVDLNRMKELGIDVSITNNILYKANLSHDFKFRSTSVTPKDSTTLLATYKSLNEVGKKWKLNSINGKEASTERIQEFDREFNTTIPRKKDKAIPSTLKIKKEDDQFIFLEYKFDKNSLSVDDYFMEKAIVSLKIEKRTKKLISANIRSSESVILKMYNVDSYTVSINYAYADNSKAIFVEDISYNFSLSLLGKKGKWFKTYDYYGFQKVN